MKTLRLLTLTVLLSLIFSSNASAKVIINDNESLSILLSKQGVDISHLTPLTLIFSTTNATLNVNDFTQTARELPFATGKQIITPRFTADAQVKWTAAEPVKTNDVVLFRIWLRSRDLGGDFGLPPITDFFIRRGESNYTNIQKGRVFPVSGTWQAYYYYAVIPSPSTALYGTINVGVRKQEFDVGGVEAVNLGSGIDVDKLPVTQGEISYSGRELNAAWRIAADKRIDAIRKGNIKIEVVDSKGKPVKNAEVQVAMTRHDFNFGTAVTAVSIAGKPNEKYKQVLKDKFNMAVFENDMKSPAWYGRWKSPDFKQENVMKSLNWLDSMNIRVRGHCLLWADTMLTMTSGSMTNQEIIEKINFQISDKSKVFKGRILEWDVHNHPIMANYITKKIGKEALLDFWKLARAENPNVRLAINEGSVLRQPFQNTLKFKEHIAWLLENKAPVQSIGFMSHFSSSTLNHPENVLVMLDDFAKFKLPLIITEFDMSVDRSNPEEIALQNDFTRDFLTVCFSHPAVDVFMSWGFWAGSHWKPDAAYYDTDWTLRPNGKAYMDLVFGKWWTNENLKTNQKGAGHVRGFKGDYKITAKLNGLTGTAQPKLVGDSIIVKIVLK